MPALTAPDLAPQKHSAADDVQGLAFGVFTCALGIVFLSHLGFLTGQTAGLALLISYVTGTPFGIVFFLVNLPFYWFTYKRMGLAFTLKSAVCVTALSLCVELLKNYIVFEHLDPLTGTLAFGALSGVGILAIIRHGGSLGGVGAMAVVFQEAFGLKAGYVQQAVDFLIFAAALVFFPFSIVAWSVFGSLVLNAIITINHRRDRYIAT